MDIIDFKDEMTLVKCDANTARVLYETLADKLAFCAQLSDEIEGLLTRLERKTAALDKAAEKMREEIN